jgi:hypothetical protein
MFASAQGKSKPPVFTPLSAESKIELEEFRRLVSNLIVKQSPTQKLSRTKKDIDVLQSLVEDPSMKRMDWNTWVAVGVAFGDALIDYIPGLAWSDVQDEYGQGVVLRYKETTLTIAAPVMLAKRVDRGEKFELPFMAGELKKFVNENVGKIQ